MDGRLTSLLLIVLFTCGCSVQTMMKAEDVDPSNKDVHVLSAELLDGRILNFRTDPFGYAILRDTVIFRWLETERIERLSLDSVSQLFIERPATVLENAFNVILGAAAVGLGFILFLSLIWSGTFH